MKKELSKNEKIKIAIAEIAKEIELYEPEEAWDGTEDGDWVGVLTLAIIGLERMDPDTPMNIGKHMCCKHCGTLVFERDNYCSGCGKAIQR